MNKNHVGARIVVARKRAGLSLRALASAMGAVVTPQALGKYERGEMMPSSQVLEALVATLDVGLDFLMAPAGVALGAIDFRKHSGTSAKERAIVEAAVLDHTERYLLVEEALDLESTSWDPPMRPAAPTRMEDAEAAAGALRGAWGLGDAPIGDLTDLLETKGMKVMLLDLPARVSGLTCLIERPGGQAVPVVVVNSGKAHPLERRRLTLAHELAHRVMAASDRVDPEKAATRFAGAFLMPGARVLREIGRCRSGLGVEEIMEAKRVFRVSAAALVVRLRDLGVITPEQLTYVFQTIGRTWRSAEPRPIETEARRGDIEAPRRFVRLCLRAHAEGLIGEARACELLDRDAKALAVLMRGGAG